MESDIKSKNKEVGTSSVKLVGGKKLLEILFDEDSRPSLRWLRMQQRARVVPVVKVGRLVFFSPEAVKAALEKRNTIHPR